MKKKTPDCKFGLQETYMSSDTSYCQFKESKRAVNSIGRLVEEDDEDVEKVSWSGEPVGSETLSPDYLWRISVSGCKVYIPHLSPQVSLGQSEKQKYPIRGQRESPPSLKELLAHRASAGAALGTLSARSSKVRHIQLT